MSPFLKLRSARAENLSDYFRVPLDSRDYSVYFEEWEEGPVELESYTSHSTEQRNVKETKKLLLTIPELQQEIGL
jgi:hypothetical protein